MSIALMSDVWLYSKQEGSSLLLLLAIADFANDNGLAWPSIVTLAQRTRQHRRTVERQIQKLEESGELKVRRAINKPNLYEVVIEGRQNAATGKSPRGVAMSGQSGVAMPPEPSRTTIKETSSSKLFEDDIEKTVESYLEQLWRAFPSKLRGSKKAVLPAMKKAFGRLVSDREWQNRNLGVGEAFFLLLEAVNIYRGEVETGKIEAKFAKWAQGWFNDSRYIAYAESVRMKAPEESEDDGDLEQKMLAKRGRA
jgi:hypothetical protein